MIPNGSQVIMWCNLCQAAPAEGKLEILEEGETQTRTIDACSNCVERVQKWL